MSVSNIKHDGDIVWEYKPRFRLYKDGSYERNDFPDVPPSLDDPITGVSSKDITISKEISARLYLPKLNSPNQKLPILVYIHGGAFCFETAFEAYYHDYMNALVKEANVVVVSVEYRLAPEHPLPAAYEDSWNALQWVASHSDNEAKIEKEPWLINHGDFDKFFINGDSAGANIVNNMVMRAGTEKLHGDVIIAGAILAFPYFWGSKPIGSMSSESNMQSLSYKIWEFVYPLAPGGIDCALINPIADGAPSLAQIRCSKMLVVTGELDEVRERGIQYVEAVKKSEWKGEIELVDVEGEDHCFQMEHLQSEKARDLIKRLAYFINK
ncbi:deacetylase [Lithospermum erythrorhizon]|uniref:Deacetylase n=1 Tax=Lithospermum erythrorhizon TaxID=34254 RepID=A0AAV3RUP8_LITER